MILTFQPFKSNSKTLWKKDNLQRRQKESFPKKIMNETEPRTGNTFNDRMKHSENEKRINRRAFKNKINVTEHTNIGLGTTFKERMKHREEN